MKVEVDPRLAPQYVLAHREDMGSLGFLETHVAEYRTGHLIKEVAVTTNRDGTTNIVIALCFVPV